MGELDLVGTCTSPQLYAPEKELKRMGAAATPRAK